MLQLVSHFSCDLQSYITSGSLLYFLQVTSPTSVLRLEFNGGLNYPGADYIIRRVTYELDKAKKSGVCYMYQYVVYTCVRTCLVALLLFHVCWL